MINCRTNDPDMDCSANDQIGSSAESQHDRLLKDPKSVEIGRSFKDGEYWRIIRIA